MLATQFHVSIHGNIQRGTTADGINLFSFSLSEYTFKPVSARADRLHRRAASEVSKLDHGADFALPERGFVRLFATTDLAI